MTVPPVPIETIESLYQQSLQSLYAEPDAPRLDFEVDGRLVGSILPADARLLSDRVPGLMLDDDTLSLLPVCASDGEPALRAIAEVLRDTGRSARWRNEALAVLSDDGTVVGPIERACMRVLGLRTLAVHVVAQDDGDRASYWLQRRSASKDTDPGMLDNLASGLVGMDANGQAPEALNLAAWREADEEAGLDREQIGALELIGRWRMQAPVPEGYMVEDVIVYRARLNATVKPENRDGEVSEFLRVSCDELLPRIIAGELTEGARLAQLACLYRDYGAGLSQDA